MERINKVLRRRTLITIRRMRHQGHVRIMRALLTRSTTHVMTISPTQQGVTTMFTPLNRILIKVGHSSLRPTPLSRRKRRQQATSLLTRLFTRQTTKIVSRRRSMLNLRTMRHSNNTQDRHVTRVINTLTSTILRHRVRVMKKTSALMLIMVKAHRRNPGGKGVRFIITRQQVKIISGRLNRRHRMIRRKAQDQDTTRRQVRQRTINQAIKSGHSPTSVNLSRLCHVGLTGGGNINRIRAIPMVPTRMITLHIIKRAQEHSNEGRGPRLKDNKNLLPQQATATQGNTRNHGRGGGGAMRGEDILYTGVIFFQLRSCRPPNRENSSNKFTQ